MVLASGDLLVLQSSLPQAGSLELRPACPVASPEPHPSRTSPHLCA